MKIEFDIVKSAANEQRRGFGFDFAARVLLDGQRFEIVDDRFDYGEIRVRTIGAIANDVFAVVYTRRGDTIRVISARKANRHERQQYQDRNSESE
ncbi:MAG: BrnT family toxin [Alphaproteobacteria bacterium]|nr:BrnT family toxin [Alphaproteobacteria bacterium]